MQPSTWNDTNQHWIPQFLLKGFGIRRMASRVYELDKQTKAVAVRDVSEAASKTHLLTDQDDKLMRDVEGRAAAAVDAIRKGHLSRICEDDRQVIDQLVCAMILNDPYSGFDVEDTRKKSIAELLSKMNEAAKKHGGILDEPEFTNFFDERLSDDRLSGFLDWESNQVIIALKLMGLQVCKPTDGEFFIIGDSPVLVVRDAVNGQTSLLNRGSQVILPISSRCILVYTWAIQKNVVDDGGTLDREQVRSLNADYYHGTKCRYVYGRNQEVLKRSPLLSLKWTPRERSNDVKDGWFTMQSLQRMMERDLEAQHAQQANILEYAARELVEATISQSEDNTTSSEHRQ